MRISDLAYHVMIANLNSAVSELEEMTDSSEDRNCATCEVREPILKKLRVDLKNVMDILEMAKRA